MSFDFGNEPGYNPEHPFYIADNRKNAIDSAMMSLGKATQSWENNSKNEDIIYAIVDATAKADFHKKKGYLCNDENAIVYEDELKKLFGIEFSAINLHSGVIIESADRYIYLTQHSCDSTLPIEQADKSYLFHSTLDQPKPVYVFQSKSRIKRGDYEFCVSKIRKGCDYVYAFRGVYDIKGSRISDYGAL